ncbi:hypothetical protein [Aeromonas media]
MLSDKLQTRLADYPDTLLLVSHDPDFVAGVGIEREYWLEGGEKQTLKSV